ncbi:MAG: hypothetical protein ACPGYT_01765 [Nitrospirales bacterium]
MRLCLNIFGLSVGFLAIGMSGCVTTPSLRLPVVLGLPMDKQISHTQPMGQWPSPHSMGLLVYSDATGSDASPAISVSMLSRLSQRTQSYIEKHCGVSALEIITTNTVSEDLNFSSLLKVAKKHDLESLMIVLFSSTELSEAATFGEERMMTQMPGTTTHNSALVELAFVDVEKGSIEIQAHGEGRESLERLTVPIGTDQLTNETALDILRANAGQQALDQALPEFTKGCRTS